jgi:hypothetical protein
MMGREKLSAIRARVRESFKLPDAQLLAWFNRQLQDLGKRPKTNQVEIDTLRLLRDSLINEAKRPAPRRRSPRVTSRSKR